MSDEQGKSLPPSANLAGLCKCTKCNCANCQCNEDSCNCETCPDSTNSKCCCKICKCKDCKCDCLVGKCLCQNCSCEKCECSGATGKNCCSQTAQAQCCSTPAQCCSTTKSCCIQNSWCIKPCCGQIPTCCKVAKKCCCENCKCPNCQCINKNCGKPVCGNNKKCVVDESGKKICKLSLKDGTVVDCECKCDSEDCCSLSNAEKNADGTYSCICKDKNQCPCNNCECSTKSQCDNCQCTDCQCKNERKTGFCCKGVPSKNCNCCGGQVSCCKPLCCKNGNCGNSKCCCAKACTSSCCAVKIPACCQKYVCPCPQYGKPCLCTLQGFCRCDNCTCSPSLASKCCKKASCKKNQKCFIDESGKKICKLTLDDGTVVDCECKCDSEDCCSLNNAQKNPDGTYSCVCKNTNQCPCNNCACSTKTQCNNCQCTDCQCKNEETKTTSCCKNVLCKNCNCCCAQPSCCKSPCCQNANCGNFECCCAKNSCQSANGCCASKCCTSSCCAVKIPAYCQKYVCPCPQYGKPCLCTLQGFCRCDNCTCNPSLVKKCCKKVACEKNQKCFIDESGKKICKLTLDDGTVVDCECKCDSENCCSLNNVQKNSDGTYSCVCKDSNEV